MSDTQNETGAREVHTYPDGSQRVGVAPFPKLSPKEEADGVQVHSAANTPGMAIPQGVKTSGATPPAEGNAITSEEFRAKVESQVKQDVLSGKSPDTPNPTTASDKPGLAGVAEVIDGKDPGNPDDLKSLTAGINPDIKASKEQIEAAATQVARETAGLVVDGKKVKK